MDLRAASGVASGLLLLLLAAALLSARPRRGPTVMFAGFTLLWAGEAFAFAYAVVADLDTLAVALAVGLAFIIPQTLLLVHFAVTYSGARPAWTFAIAAVTVGTALAMAVAPGLFVNGFDFTPAAAFLILLPNFAALYMTTALLVRRHAAATSAIARREATVILAALALYTGYTTGFFFVSYAADWSYFAAAQGAPAAAAFVALFAAGLVLLAALGASVLAKLRSKRAPDRRASDLRVAVALVVPPIAGLAAASPILLDRAPFEILGAVRAATAAVIAYGLLKFQLFGLDLKLKRGLALAFPFLVAGAIEVAAGVFADPFLNRLSGPLFIGAHAGIFLVAATVAAPLRQRVADWVFPYVDESADYKRARSLEVYRSALARAVSDGVEDDPFLRDLRADLRIRDADHARLLRAIRAERGEAPAEVGVRVAGRYEREKLLGEGNLARTWLARDVVVDRRVVLKELVEKGRRAAERARRAARADGAHVVALYDVVEEGNRTVLVTEHVPSGSLADRLEAAGKLPREEALRVTAEILRGLASLHDARVLHGNLSPRNVLFAADGRAKLADGGIFADPSSGLETRAAEVAAEPHALPYMSPERVRGVPETESSDVWSAGVLLYRALTGRFPLDFGDGGDYEIRRRILDDEVDLPLASEPGVVDAILFHALAKDPGDRYASAAAMLEAVEAARREGL